MEMQPETTRGYDLIPEGAHAAALVKISRLEAALAPFAEQCQQLIDNYGADRPDTQGQPIVVYMSDVKRLLREAGNRALPVRTRLAAHDSIHRLVAQWQEDRGEYHGDTIVGIVTEYAIWRENAAHREHSNFTLHRAVTVDYRPCRHCEQNDPHCSVCEGVGYLP